MTPFTDRTRRRWAFVAMLFFGIPMVLAMVFPGTLADIYYHLRYPEVMKSVEAFAGALAAADIEGAKRSSGDEPGQLVERLMTLDPDRREALRHVFQPVVRDGITIRGIQTLSPNQCLVVLHYPARPGPEGSSHVDLTLARTDHWRVQSVSFVRIPDWPGGNL